MQCVVHLCLRALLSLFIPFLLLHFLPASSFLLFCLCRQTGGATISCFLSVCVCLRYESSMICLSSAQHKHSLSFHSSALSSILCQCRRRSLSFRFCHITSALQISKISRYQFFSLPFQHIFFLHSFLTHKLAAAKFIVLRYFFLIKCKFLSHLKKNSVW